MGRRSLKQDPDEPTWSPTGSPSPPRMPRRSNSGSPGSPWLRRLRTSWWSSSANGTAADHRWPRPHRPRRSPSIPQATSNRSATSRPRHPATCREPCPSTCPPESSITRNSPRDHHGNRCRNCWRPEKTRRSCRRRSRSTTPPQQSSGARQN